MNIYIIFHFTKSHLFCSVPWQYYHSVRVFAGQDPASVWVGWVTPDYHYHCKTFSLGKMRTVTVTLGDERGRVHERQATCFFLFFFINVWTLLYIVNYREVCRSQEESAYLLNSLRKSGCTREFKKCAALL